MQDGIATCIAAVLSLPARPPAHLLHADGTQHGLGGGVEGGQEGVALHTVVTHREWALDGVACMPRTWQHGRLIPRPTTLSHSPAEDQDQ